MMDNVIDDLRARILEALIPVPYTAETRSALIGLLITFASGLAAQEPERVRKHWAEEFYKDADRLAGPQK